MQVEGAEWLGRGDGGGWETHLSTGGGIAVSNVRKRDVQDALLDGPRRGAWIKVGVRDGSYMIVRRVEAGAYDIEYCSLIVQHPERATKTMDQSTADKRLLAFFGGNTDWRGAYDWEPVVQLRTEAGQGVSRPSEESVRRVAFDARKTGGWICLARSSGEFVQAEPTGAGLFAIERSRDGMGWPERSTRELMAPELADALADYLGGRDEWQVSHEWRSVSRDKPQRTGCSAVLAVFAGALLVLASVMTS